MDHKNLTPTPTRGNAAGRTSQSSLGRQAPQAAPRTSSSADRTTPGEDQGQIEYASWLRLLRKRVA